MEINYAENYFLLKDYLDIIITGIMCCVLLENMRNTMLVIYITLTIINTIKSFRRYAYDGKN